MTKHYDYIAVANKKKLRKSNGQLELQIKALYKYLYTNTRQNNFSITLAAENGSKQTVVKQEMYCYSTPTDSLE